MSKYKYDFNEVKKLADVEFILDQLDLPSSFRARGDERVGRCMLGDDEHGKGDSLSFNVEKKTFQCFSCKKRGSIIDFVRFFERLTLPEAAGRIMEIMRNADTKVENNRTASTYQVNQSGMHGSEDAVLQEARKIMQSRVSDGLVIDSQEKAAHVFTFDIGTEDQEIFSMISLDSNLQAINYTRLASGSVSQVGVQVREVARRALLDNATQVICGHNHPAGDVTPSKQDIALTQELFKALKIFDIHLCDHVIVSGDKSLSMHEHKLIHAPRKKSRRKKKSKQPKVPLTNEEFKNSLADYKERENIALNHLLGI